MNRNVVFYLTLCVLPISCTEKDDGPDFPLEPYIEFRTAEFKTANLPNLPDTINISFYFRDGDFDLGLDASEKKIPYNWFYYYRRATGGRIGDDQFQDGEYSVTDLLRYRDKRTMVPDTLPAFETPYSCRSWRIVKDDNLRIIDTLYFSLNPNFYNIDVRIFLRNQSGIDSLFDFSEMFVYPNCQLSGFDGRFSSPRNGYPIGAPFSVTMLSRKEGIFTYHLRTSGWTTFFPHKKLRFKLRIRDRALHTSNEIETPEVQIP